LFIHCAVALYLLKERAMPTLQQKAEQLAKHMFVGGPVKDFEKLGRLQLMLLLQEGVYPHSKVLDIGCGCLRGGYWLIHFLNPHCYCGIEPNRAILRAGLDQLLDPEVIQTKYPRFDHNDRFDSSVFGERFDVFLARSIWTHASKAQIEHMLDAFARWCRARGFPHLVFTRALATAGLHGQRLGGAQP
jgi:hypothetical protein